MGGDDAAARASAAVDALREGLGIDSDDEAAAAEPPAPPPASADAPASARDPGPPSLATQVEQLKEVIDGLKAALHAERATVRDKDVQLHKLLAERDMVVGARRAPRAACVASLAARVLCALSAACGSALRAEGGADTVRALWHSGRRARSAAAWRSALRGRRSGTEALTFAAPRSRCLAPRAQATTAAPRRRRWTR